MQLAARPASDCRGRRVRWPGGDLGGRDVGGEQGQVGVGPRDERPACARVELVLGEAAVHVCVFQRHDDLLAVGVARPELVPARRCQILRSRCHRRLPR